VVTHAAGVTAPPLDDAALVMRGGSHYDLACRACHGAADGTLPMIPASIVPPPRPLARHARDWRARELFYIVKHGMKFTGMPAWPAQQRDDEVWAMVAFLRALPALDRSGYDRLVRSETSAAPLDLVSTLPAPEVVTENCSRCHGLDGRGRARGAFPRLDGQRPEYLERALRAYANGQRHSGIMGPIAAALVAEARREAVDYYASLSRPETIEGLEGTRDDAPRAGTVDGQAIATNGDPEQLIPACIECHGPAPSPKNPAFPRLAGQDARYLEQQLRLLRAGARGGSDYVDLMQTFAGRLTDAQIAAVSAYYAAIAD
jgi:cytochrome c553